MRALLVALTSGALLTGCSAPGETAVERALEKAWSEDTVSMEVATGMLTEDQARGLRGVQSSARATSELLRSYAGDTATKYIGDLFASATEFASEMAGSEDRAFARHTLMVTARDWDATNVELIASRQSDDDYVVQVRYDILATVAGHRQQIASDVVQTIRLESRDGAWQIIKSSKSVDGP